MEYLDKESCLKLINHLMGCNLEKQELETLLSNFLKANDIKLKKSTSRCLASLIIDGDGKTIKGYGLYPETEEEDEVVAEIRDLTFFSYGDNALEYSGITLKDPKVGKVMGNIKSIEWIRKGVKY